MKRVFITGITGMIGTALSKHLISKGHEVGGISRSTSSSRMANTNHYLGDILDKGFIGKSIFDFKPDVVFHLAAQAFNGNSWDCENTTYLTNIQGSKNVFDACRNWENASVIPACSSAQYGRSKVSVKESDPLNPITPYGVSKACMEMMGRQYGTNYYIPFMFPRLFINVGTGHPPATLIQNIGRQFAESVKYGKKKFYIGNVDSLRDYIDVEDGVEALELLMNSGENLESYNVCSGQEYSVIDIVNMFIDVSGVNPEMLTDVTLLRPSDESRLLGDPSKINRLGWEAKIPMEQTIEKVFNDWRNRV